MVQSPTPSVTTRQPAMDGIRPLPFAQLLGSVAQTHEMDPRAVMDPLMDEEAKSVAGAMHKRVQHFAAGRACARRALARLGLSYRTVIPMREDASPQWPRGIVGSITHTDLWCAAAVAHEAQLQSVGIDVEAATPLRQPLHAIVCTPNERRRLGASGRPGLTAKLIFSAKEAFYKCQYTVTGEFLDFQDVELRWGQQEFEGRFVRKVGPFEEGSSLHGRFMVREPIVATACWIPQGGRQR